MFLYDTLILKKDTMKFTLSVRLIRNSFSGPKMSNSYQSLTRKEIDLLNQQAMEMRHQDTPRALITSLKARDAALKIDYQLGYAQSLYLVSVCQFILAEPVNVKEMAYQAYSLFKSLGNLQGQALALNLIGNIYDRQNEHEEAIKHHLNSLQLRQAIGDMEGQAGSLNNIGLAYASMNQLAEALEYLFRSLDLSESINSDISCAYALCNIAEIFAQLGEYSSALQYNQRGLALVNQTKDRALKSTALTTLGHIYAQMGNHNKALQYHRKSLSLAKQTGNLHDQGLAMLGLGISHQENRKYATANQTLRQALERMQVTGAKDDQVRALCAIGKNYLHQEQQAQAIEHLQHALEISKQVGEKHIDEVHLLLSEAYQQQGNYELALNHFRGHHAAQQKIFNRDSQRRIRTLLARTEIKEARREVEEQRIRNDELEHALQAAEQADREKESLLQQLATQAEMLEKLAHEDGLTGIANRRWLDILFLREFERARRFGHQLSVAMIDIDDFKKVNDRLSHLVGDDVLRAIARLIRDNSRTVDVVGRYGGEEFMLVMVETNLEQARHTCEKIRRKVKSHQWEKTHPALKSVTISLGVASNQTIQNPEELVRLADSNLYQAKKRGKNQVFSA
jgi:diguanylate cyclase (GGDEF)-like protein